MRFLLSVIVALVLSSCKDYFLMSGSSDSGPVDRTGLNFGAGAAQPIVGALATNLTDALANAGVSVETSEVIVKSATLAAQSSPDAISASQSFMGAAVGSLSVNNESLPQQLALTAADRADVVLSISTTILNSSYKTTGAYLAQNGNTGGKNASGGADSAVTSDDIDKAMKSMAGETLKKLKVIVPAEKLKDAVKTIMDATAKNANEMHNKTTLTVDESKAAFQSVMEGIFAEAKTIKTITLEDVADSVVSTLATVIVAENFSSKDAGTLVIGMSKAIVTNVSSDAAMADQASSITLKVLDSGMKGLSAAGVERASLATAIGSFVEQVSAAAIASNSDSTLVKQISQTTQKSAAVLASQNGLEVADLSKAASQGTKKAVFAGNATASQAKLDELTTQINEGEQKGLVESKVVSDAAMSTIMTTNQAATAAIIVAAQTTVVADVIAIARGNNQSGPAGSQLPEPFVVIVKDAAGKGVPDVSITWAMATASGSLTSTLTTKTGPDGMSIGPKLTLGTIPGAYSVTATMASGSTKVVTFAATAGYSALSLTKASGDNQTRIAGSASEALVVEVKDAFGNVVPSATVMWKVTYGAGSLIGDAITVTDSAGRSAKSFNLGPVVGISTNRVEAALASDPTKVVSFIVSSSVGAAASITAVSGQIQSRVFNSKSLPLIAVVKDSSGNPLPNVPVMWSASGGAMLVGSRATTNADGTTTNEMVLGGSGTSNYTATAMLSSDQSKSVTFNVAGYTATTPYTLTKVSGSDNQSALRGTVLKRPLAVIVTDASSNPVPGVYPNWASSGGVISSSGLTNFEGIASAEYKTNPGTILSTPSVGVSGDSMAFSATGTSTLLPGSTPMANIESMAISDRIGCAVLFDGTNPRTLKCWGALPGGAITSTPVTIDMPGGAVTQVAPGQSHICALAASQVYCWGSGPAALGASTPTAVTGLTSATFIASGKDFSCAIAGGNVHCWGDNTNSQLGRGTGAFTSVGQVGTAISSPIKLALGDAHACALGGTTVYCWGANASGQVGNNSTAVQNIPVSTSVTTATDIAAGASHSCAITNSGASCWGNNINGQLGYFTSGGFNSSPAAVDSASAATSIAAGANHTCISVSSASPRCFGDGSQGQSGPTYGSPGYSGFDVSNVTSNGVTVTKMLAGGNLSCARLDDKTAKCWGNDDTYDGTARSVGQAGNGGATELMVPAVVPGLTGVKQTDGMGQTRCALLYDGTVKCWGLGTSGQLGNGLNFNSLEPVTVIGLAGAIQISVGSMHSCALLTSGEVRCWGYNMQSQLGFSYPYSSHTPLTAGYDFTQISAGYYHTCGVKANGTVFCWGYNNNSQLGNNSTTSSYSPVQAGDFTNARMVSAGGNHTCAVLTDGSVKCWGSNYSGALGLGNTASDYTSPTTVPDITAVAIATTNMYSCALLGDGTVSCWGTFLGGLHSSPTQVSGVSGATKIGVGASGYGYAVINDGSVMTWNSGGTASTVQGIAAAVDVSPRFYYVDNGIPQPGFGLCAILDNATMSCYGQNHFGVLGTGIPMSAQKVPNFVIQ